jgi:hypothetical protein
MTGGGPINSRTSISWARTRLALGAFSSRTLRAVDGGDRTWSTAPSPRNEHASVGAAMKVTAQKTSSPIRNEFKEPTKSQSTATS